ncbi:hypothetical protein DIPPA_24582 [Diplonema papillatum]|nr:hypothetical protein DIPPA_24582 [Diplonema papillatum]
MEEAVSMSESLHVFDTFGYPSLVQKRLNDSSRQLQLQEQMRPARGNAPRPSSSCALVLKPETSRPDSNVESRTPPRTAALEGNRAQLLAGLDPGSGFRGGAVGCPPDFERARDAFGELLDSSLPSWSRRDGAAVGPAVQALLNELNDALNC